LQRGIRKCLLLLPDLAGNPIDADVGEKTPVCTPASIVKRERLRDGGREKERERVKSNLHKIHSAGTLGERKNTPGFNLAFPVETFLLAVGAGWADNVKGESAAKNGGR
jgi:hypothetical protein